jgi:hypothetical protein
MGEDRYKISDAGVFLDGHAQTPLPSQITIFIAEPSYKSLSL